MRYTADQQAKLELWLRQSRQLHWWFPYEGIVLACERHTSAHVDDRGRLHHPTEMACGYSDGWGIYAWHGVRIPESYFANQPDPATILTERNAEVRRALMERYDALNGKGRFIQDAGAKVIDSAIQPMRPGEQDSLNELLAIDLPDDDPEAKILAVKMVDPSTDRVYIIRVHPECRPLHADGSFGEPQAPTVRNALASTHGLRGEEYVLAAES